MTLRVGLLGAAAIAPAAVIDPARSNTEVEIAAVAARDRNRALAYAGEHGIPVAYGDYQELLDDPDIDAVYNPTPNALHGTWTLAALDAGKHVLCEKPLTANAEEARQIAAAADAAGLVVMEAFHYRYHPVMLRVLDIVGSGELGRLRSIESGFGGSGPGPDDIRWRLALGGGSLMDVGCYAAHFLRSIVGEGEVVRARAHERDVEVDADIDIDMLFADGVTGRIVSSMQAESYFASGRVTGELGTLDVAEPFLPQRGNSIRVAVGDEVRVERLTTQPSYDFQLLAFADAVLRGAPVVTDTVDAIANMELIDAAYLAAGLHPRRPAARETTEARTGRAAPSCTPPSTG